MTELEHMAARIALGQVSAHEIQATVDALLTGGVYCDAFIPIIDSKAVRRDDVLGPFVVFLRSQGIVVPTEERAVWQLIAHRVSRMASGTGDLLEELGDLIAEVCWDYDFGSVTKELLGDSHGIEYLLGLHWGYECMTIEGRGVSKRKVRRLKQQIIKHAKEWMGRLGSGLQRSGRKTIAAETQWRANHETIAGTTARSDAQGSVVA